MLGRIKDKIKARYYWFWHDYMGRSESYTASVRKDIKRRPWLWIGVPAGVAIAYYLFIWHLGGFL